jgi:hypothetical protein
LVSILKPLQYQQCYSVRPISIFSPTFILTLTAPALSVIVAIEFSDQNKQEKLIIEILILIIDVINATLMAILAKILSTIGRKAGCRTLCQGCNDGEGAWWITDCGAYYQHIEDDNVCKICDLHFESVSNLQYVSGKMLDENDGTSPVGSIK